MLNGNTHHTILHGHLFCGLGGGAKGFNATKARHGTLSADFECLGGIDVDPAAIRDFERLAGVPGTVLDLFDRGQYRTFHGTEPPADWREAGPQDIHRAFGFRRPHILFLSAPCKGFSGLLSERTSRTPKYQALNRLTLRGIWLTLEAYKDDPIEFILFENVPRIATRGRELLDQIVALLRAYGYAVAETTHDCGELGGLAQRRKRFLLVARHAQKVRPFLWEPPKRALQGVGDVLSRMKLPGDADAGPMHRIPRLHWQTWVRLAFVEAGKDWRSLERLAVQDGLLRDYALVQDSPGCSPAASEIPDPRPSNHRKFANIYRVVAWDAATSTVIGRSQPSDGAMSVADPRPGLARGKGDDYLTAGHYGVVRWKDGCGAVSAAAGHDNGRWAVADPRPPLRAHDDRLISVIRAEDGTWHRPFTTAELACLQSLFDPEEQAELDGLNDTAWRERIGNAVPPDAAQAIAEAMGRTLLAAWSGESFMLSAAPIWVRPIAIAASVDVPLYQ
ncbi:DNA cytosine methyltransferase [Gluconacetobacter sp.]|uniref:DNA cytosine methyltransferase n=1 Tax=Gluconacetobacter sp. TaxID=1935994 RepID=UPI0039ED0700